jgi:hypothetical protein
MTARAVRAHPARALVIYRPTYDRLADPGQLQLGSAPHSRCPIIRS